MVVEPVVSSVVADGVRRSVAGRVTEWIRDAILTGELAPGHRITVEHLARSLGTSHIPVREALNRLEAESLVTSEAHRWTVVKDLSVAELADLYQLRRLVECGYAAVEVPAGAAPLDRIDELLEELVVASSSDGGRDFWDVHRRFHRALLAPALAGWGTRVLDLVWQSSERYQRLYAKTHGEAFDEANDEHREMVDLVRRGDRAELAAAIGRHLTRTEAALRVHFDAALAPTGVGLDAGPR